MIVTNSVPLKDFLKINAGKTCMQYNTREPDVNECNKYASETSGVTFAATPIGLVKASGCIVLKDKVYFQPNENPQKCFSSAKCICVSGMCFVCMFAGVYRCVCVRMGVYMYMYVCICAYLLMFMPICV